MVTRTLPPVLLTTKTQGEARFEGWASARIRAKSIARSGFAVLVENRSEGEVVAFLPNPSAVFGWIEARGPEGRRLYQESPT